VIAFVVPGVSTTLAILLALIASIHLIAPLDRDSVDLVSAAAARL
jgi:hypothetical protein